MKRIGVLSDTHSYLDPKIFQYFKEVDEIWHAGDLGHIDIADQLKLFKPTKLVYGNIDGHIIRAGLKEVEIFSCEELKVMMIHIAGKFSSYTEELRKLILEEKPGLLVCGHSHLLKVAFDKKNQLLYLNPGACGIVGFHTVRTIVRFSIEGKEIRNMEVIELMPRHKP